MQALAFTGVRGMQGVKTATVTAGDRELKIAVVSGLGNAAKLIERIQVGDHYDFVEVMACPGGCVSGAGQPFAAQPEKDHRSKQLYSADRLSSIKRSEENPLMMSLYGGLLKGRVHELLHVDYVSEVKK